MITLFVSTRNTIPDIIPLRNVIRIILSDITALIYLSEPFNFSKYSVESAGIISAGNITLVQNAIDTASEYTLQRVAQDHIDNLPIVEKAIILALIDQLNVIRAALVPPKVAITPAQALQAVRDKAGTL